MDGDQAFGLQSLAGASGSTLGFLIEVWARACGGVSGGYSVEVVRNEKEKCFGCWWWIGIYKGER